MSFVKLNNFASDSDNLSMWVIDLFYKFRDKFFKFANEGIDTDISYISQIFVSLKFLIRIFFFFTINWG